MSETSITTPAKTAPTSNSEPASEQPQTVTLSPRHRENLKAIDAQMSEAIQQAAHPFQERMRGYLAGLMAELDLKGNWDYDAQTFTFTRK